MKHSQWLLIVRHLLDTGFFYQNSEIYHGLSHAWDYGPLGTLLKNNLKKVLRDFFITQENNVWEIDTNIILKPDVWKASGHVAKFFDAYVTCQKCNSNFKQDDHQVKQCPKCQQPIIAASREFNLLFKTHLGVVTTKQWEYFLRPETSQGIFINFHHIKRTLRPQLPFAIAQFGKSFRNEITPRYFIFRTREFEQMEMVYFINPEATVATKTINFLLQKIKTFLDLIKINTQHYQVYQHQAQELAHYALATWDINYHFPFGWQEIWGLANRGDYDLKNHQKKSGTNLQYFDPLKKKYFWPYSIEPSVGIDRLLLAIICEHFFIEKINDTTQRTVLNLPPALSPYQVMVTSLAKKLHLDAKKSVYHLLKQTTLRIYFDEHSNIGKKYRRADAIGVNYCVTFDYTSLQDQTVTVRIRETMQQTRVKIENISLYLMQALQHQNN